MLRNSSAFLWVSLFVTFGACSESGGGGDGDGDACAPGSEGCPCDKGTCDGALECRSNFCVEGGTGGNAGTSSGGTGAATGGSGGGGAGGTSGGSGGGPTGGMPQGGAAGSENTGGGGASGAQTGGSSGAGASNGGGSGACGDTSSDPMNCGQCGHACNGDCMNGQCRPYMAGCFNGDDGFPTCAAYCTSLGETCVMNGCGSPASGGMTVAIWDSSRGSLCESDPGSADLAGQSPCDSMFQFTAGFWWIRCCCTDTR
jgi:hypothetical protein